MRGARYDGWHNVWLLLSETTRARRRHRRRREVTPATAARRARLRTAAAARRGAARPECTAAAWRRPRWRSRRRRPQCRRGRPPSGAELRREAHSGTGAPTCRRGPRRA